MEKGVAEQFIADAKVDLGDFVRQSGLVLYSSPKTLKPGDVYLLGLNPGLDRAGSDGPDIEDHLDKLGSTDTNSYLDGEWLHGRRGLHIFQLRVVWLLGNLGFDPRDVCASNLIFRRSRGEGDCGYPEAANRCWPVHRRILRIVQPKLVICLGNLPFKYVISRAGHNGSPKEFAGGHGNWQCRAAHVQIEGRQTDVVRIPHLRRYNIIGKTTVVEWIKKKLVVLTVASRDVALPQTPSAPVPPPRSFPVPPTPAAPTSKVEDYYHVPWNHSDGYIILTGKPFSAKGARGAAWETLRTRNGISVESWTPIAKKAGNAGCGGRSRYLMR